MDKSLISGLDKGVGGSWPGCGRVPARVWAGPGQGVGGSRLAAEFLKIESFFFFFSLQKHEKSF
jgi:hypothetical protein